MLNVKMKFLTMRRRCRRFLVQNWPSPLTPVLIFAFIFTAILIWLNQVSDQPIPQSKEAAEFYLKLFVNKRPTDQLASFDLVGFYSIPRFGGGLVNLTSKFSTKIEKALSPETNEAAKLLFPDPKFDNNDRQLHILSPGFTFTDGGKLIKTVSRVWFSNLSNFTNENWPRRNLYFENYIVEQLLFASNFTQASKLSFLPVAAPRQFADGGPSDPRLFKSGPNKMFALFYLQVVDDSLNQGRMFLWNMDNHRPLILRISGNFKMAESESNWSPFEQETDELTDSVPFIYSYNPMEILQCSVIDGKCSFISKSPLNVDAIRWNLTKTTMKSPDDDFGYKEGLVIRGGTPLVLVAEQNEFSFHLAAVHSVISRSKTMKQYGAHLVVVRMRPGIFSSACLIYISGLLKADKLALDQTRVILPETISGPFIFPVGLAVQPKNNGDCFLLSYHVSDDRSYFASYCGLEKLLDTLLSEETACLVDHLTNRGLDKLVYNMHRW